MNTLSINDFLWVKEERTFIADFSDLMQNGRLDPRHPFGQFSLHAPGRAVVVEMSDIDTNEGDIMSWEFKPVAENLDFKVVIVND